MKRLLIILNICLLFISCQNSSRSYQSVQDKALTASEKVLEIEKYTKTTSLMKVIKNGENIFIHLNKETSKEKIEELLDELQRLKCEFTFFDDLHNDNTGAFFSYSTEKNIKKHWSMTLGNDGWSGGIYHIKNQTVVQQIYNLVKHNKITKLQLTNVGFLSHYEIERKERSLGFDKKLYSIHQ